MTNFRTFVFINKPEEVWPKSAPHLFSSCAMSTLAQSAGSSGESGNVVTSDKCGAERFSTYFSFPSIKRMPFSVTCNSEPSGHRREHGPDSGRSGTVGTRVSLGLSDLGMTEFPTTAKSWWRNFASHERGRTQAGSSASPVLSNHTAATFTSTPTQLMPVRYAGALAWMPELFSDSGSLAEEGEVHVRCLGFDRVGSHDGAAVQRRQGCPFADKVGHHLQ